MGEATRREFLRSLARGTSLAGLGFLAAWLGLRAPQACRQASPCRECRLVDGCTQPRAKTFRRTGKEAGRG